MGTSQLTAKELISELNFEKYSLGVEEEDIIKKCKDVFVAQECGDRVAPIENTLEFMKSIWVKYDCKEVAEIYDKFIKMEEALFGLLREEGEGKRYRDHFVHMFNCFVFGVRFISSVFSKVQKEDFMNLFKVKDENLKEAGLPFGSDYKCHQRLFYMWTLASTFHDIAKPFQNLADLGKGINRFVDEFGWVSTNPKLTMHYFDSSQLYDYFHLISSIYGGGLQIEDDGCHYKKDNRQHYLAKMLGREFDRLDHGVLSGFFMWKTIEEIFLTDRSEKHPLNIEEFNLYTEYVLEQDIARVALAISLHGIDKDKRTGILPKVFPISFSSFPLVFLLILSDELQEYLRLEGATFKKELLFDCHPRLDTHFDKDKKAIEITVTFLVKKQNEERMVDVAKRMAEHNKQSCVNDIKGIKDAMSLIGNLMNKNLLERLRFDKYFMMQLRIYHENNEELYNIKLGIED